MLSALYKMNLKSQKIVFTFQNTFSEGSKFIEVWIICNWNHFIQIQTFNKVFQKFLG